MWVSHPARFVNKLLGEVVSKSREREGRGLGSAGGNKNRKQRRYSPTVERLEEVRLLSSASQAHPLANVAAAHDLLTDMPGAVSHLGVGSQPFSSATWDAALVETELGDILGTAGTSISTSTSAGTTLSPTVSASPEAAVDIKALSSGLTQLNKYLSRAWYRAGISPQLHDDSSQAVYTTLLQHLGRRTFDSLVTDVGHSGIKDVFTRETSEGLAFFRAVDMVKKRAQRERMHQSLDALDVASPIDQQGLGGSRRQALLEAIDRTLSPREAALIRDTLMGKSPAEIADEWGVAPKTVSNEKTRVLQKLRMALSDHEMN
jgi:DNA-binding CsgD family transcriptional regulator